MDDDFLSKLDAEATSAPAQNPDALNTLRQLADRAAGLENDINRLEKELAKKKAERYKILSRDMIDLMDAAGVTDVTFAGIRYTSGEYCKASIAKDSPHASEAYDWIAKNGGQTLLQRGVHAKFAKEFGDEAETLTRYIREHYQMAEVAVELSIPWKRLTSWVKEQRKAGVDLPLELLGATIGRVVKAETVREI